MFQISRRKHLAAAYHPVGPCTLCAAEFAGVRRGEKDHHSGHAFGFAHYRSGFTTAYITRDHGYMVYDTLLATDSSFRSSRRWRIGQCPTTS